MCCNSVTTIVNNFEYPFKVSMLVFSLFVAASLAKRRHRSTNDIDRDLDFTILYKVHRPKKPTRVDRSALPTQTMNELLRYLEKEARVEADRRLRKSETQRMRQLLDYSILSKLMRDKESDSNRAGSDSAVAPELLALMDRSENRRGRSHRSLL